MIRIRHSYYFNSSTRYSLAFISFLFLYFIAFVPIDRPVITGLMILFILLFAIIFFTRKGLIVDTDRKEYTHSIHIFNLQLGAPVPYGEIEKLFINQIKLTSRQKTIGHAAFVKSDQYVCYIKFTDGTKFLLDYDSNKEELVNRLLQYNIQLKTAIYDQTDNPFEPILIG